MAITLLFLAIGSSFAYAQPQRNKKKKSVEKQAREHLMFEEYEAAIPEIQNLLEQDPGSAYYNFWMGKSLYLTYKKNKALPYFEKVNKINPEVDEQFHYYYALTLHYNLLFDNAISEYRLEMERHEPNSPAYREMNNRIQQCFYAKNLRKRKETDLVKINNLGKSINTPYSEHSPVIAKGDSVLIFTARRPESKGAQPEQYFYDEDVYISRKTENGWSKARNIDTPVNSKGHDATISITQDGKRLYIYRHKKAGGLYVTDFDDNGKKWNEPKKIEKPLNSKYYEASICESPDGNTLFFTSDRPGGFGGRDIYKVTREGKDDWSEPKNLGPVINTAFDEDAPFLHPDGRTFYYSSNGPNSIGGFDIFVTEWDENTSTWLPSLNMGPPVNTPDDEIYFVLSSSGLEGYYSSGKEGGFGEKDIYQIQFPYFRYPKRAYVLEVVGLVQDVESLDTLPATVRLVDAENEEVLDSILTTPESRMYQFDVEPERAYTLEVVADGYERSSEDLVTPPLEDDDMTLRKDILVRRPVYSVKEEYLPEIQHVYFDFDESNLRQEAINELDMVADLLKKNRDMEVEILGHTDFYGTFDYNLDLSYARANAVVTYLKRAGVDENRLKEVFMSENKPIDTNENDKGRQYNRRVEFKFTRNSSPLFSSVRLRKGSEEPYVDHTRPKGLPGYDNPDREPVAGMNYTKETQGLGEVSDSEVYYTLGGNPDSESGSGGKNGIKNASNSTSKDELKGMSIHHIYFGFDEATLQSEAEKELSRIADLLAGNSKYTLEVRGHTDAIGSNDYNQSLSERRCDAAMRYLEQRGIPSGKVSFEGFSENKPIDSNANASGRQSNRRVEFVLKKGGETILISQP